MLVLGRGAGFYAPQVGGDGFGYALTLVLVNVIKKGGLTSHWLGLEWEFKSLKAQHYPNQGIIISKIYSQRRSEIIAEYILGIPRFDGSGSKCVLIL